MIKSPVWNDIETLWHEMDKAFTGLRFTSPVAGLVDHALGNYPSIRLHEGPEALYVEAMVPGVDPGTLKLYVVRRTLTLAGEKRALHTDTDAEPKVFHRKERSEGRFERRFTLPMEVDTEKVSAEYADGVLRITLPKLGQDTPRQIRIQTAA